MRRVTRLLTAVGAGAVLATACAAVAPAPVPLPQTVEISTGAVRGTDGGDVRRFRGIP